MGKIKYTISYCQVSLILTWSKNSCTKVSAQRDNPASSTITAPTNVTLKITATKIYVPVVTLSTENDNKLLGQLKTVFKKTIKI